MLVIAVVVAFVVAFAFDRWQVLADLDDFRLGPDNPAERVEVALQPHPGGEVKGCVGRLLEMVGGRLEVVGVAVLGDQVDDLHPHSADLAGEVAEQGMKACDFQVRGGEGDR